MCQQLSDYVATRPKQAAQASLNHVIASVPPSLHVALAYEHLTHLHSPSDTNVASFKLDCKEHSTDTISALITASRSPPHPLRAFSCEFLMFQMSDESFTFRDNPLMGLLVDVCLLYTSPSPRDQRGSRMPSSA